MQVLLYRRLIVTVLFAQGLNLLFRGARASRQPHRIGGNNPRDRKGQDGQPDQHDRDQDQPADDIGDHLASSPKRCSKQVVTSAGAYARCTPLSCDLFIRQHRDQTLDPGAVVIADLEEIEIFHRSHHRTVVVRIVEDTRANDVILRRSDEEQIGRIIQKHVLNLRVKLRTRGRVGRGACLREELIHFRVGIVAGIGPLSSLR